MFKRTKIVMLQNQKADIGADNWYLPSQKILILDNFISNLYFLSDEVPIDGDWCLSNLNEVVKFKKNYNNTLYKKIIATTDSSFPKIHKGEIVDESYPKEFRNSILPQPSKSFIEKYLEQYNENNKIEWVDVEYDNCENIPGVGDYYDLKVNPKDNTITIKKVKDSYSREELEFYLRKLNDTKEGVFDVTDWIDKNI